MKKILAMLLAVALVFSLGITAFADNTGSITVTNSVVDQTYDVYKLFDLTYTDDSVAYTYTKTGTNDALFTKLNASDSPFTLAQVRDTNLYNVTIKDGKTAADVSGFVDSLLKADPAIMTAVASDEGNGGELEFAGLAYGYYFVKSSLGVVVSIDSTLPDVDIIDKNGEPSWDNGETGPGKVIIENGEKVKVNDAAFGEDVLFDIGVNTTSYVKEKQVINFFVSDTIQDGFDYVLKDGKLDIVAVTVGDKTLDADDYSVVLNGRSFEITIPWVDEDGVSLYPSTAELHIQYKATVNENAVIGEPGNLNTANYTYQTTTPSTDPETPDTPDDKKPYEKDNERTTTTYVYALGIQKIDEEGNPLAGAEFTIEGVAANETSVAGVYEYDANGEVTTFVTNEDGQIIIKGVDAGDYVVTETKAPDGYNLLTGTKTVSASLESVSSYSETTTVYFDADGNIVDTKVEKGDSETYNFGVKVVDLVVVNEKGAELPSTGGIGTTIFYVLGSMMVLAAGVIIITKKRMENRG